MKSSIINISFPTTWVAVRSTSGRRRTMCLIIALHFFILADNTFAQTRLMLNGGYINLNEGAYLVVANPASNAITRTSGHIISEGENNIVKWQIGTTTGAYTVPWGTGTSNYIPLSFTKTAGVGSGSFLFSTYNTPSSNSSLLATGVLNFAGASGSDKSLLATDRFWQVNALGYTTKPTLTNLLFTYLDSEFASPNITSTESNLMAQRWNPVLSTWVDYVPTATTNTTLNTVTLSSVGASNFYQWWAVNYVDDRHWVATGSSTGSNASDWSYTAGGASGAVVPTALDAVLFDDVNSNNITLSGNLSVKSLTVSDGFTGIITQGSHSITAAEGASFSGGTFVGGSGDITIDGAFILSGTSFTSTSATLELKDDFNFNSGTFAHNTGTVKFSGTTGRQDVSGVSVTDFNNILITNTSATPGVSIESNQNLSGVLTVASNATLDADGSSNSAVLKLISLGDGPTQDAAVAILPSGAQITGSVTVQRFMTKEGANNNRIYRYISSPVQNASVADLQNEIPITGSFTGTSACSGCGVGQTMFSYNESDITDSNGSGTADFNDGYIDFPNAANTETLTPGKGYAMYVRGNVLSSTLWDVRGPVNAGNVSAVSLPVSYTSSGNILNDGWNLVGNPYPSTIDWNASSGWTKTNLNATTYTTDNGNASLQYATWNGVTGTNGGSRHIAMGQAFWVKANGDGTPVLQATENVKAASTQTTFFRQGSPDNLLRVIMAKGSTRDEAVIHFREDATGSFDAQADALKLPNGTFNLSSLQSDGSKLAINSIAPMNCVSEVKLSVTNAAAGTYQLNFSEHDSFMENVSIILTDNFTGGTFNVRSGGNYDFSVTANPESYGANRFKVTFMRALNSNYALSAASVCNGSDAMITIDNSQIGTTYSIATNQGVSWATAIGNAGTIGFVVPKDRLTIGQNNFVITATQENCSAKVEKNITFNVEQKFTITSAKEAVRCGPGVLTLKAAGAPANGHYNWYESATAAMPVTGQTVDVFTTSSLSKSKTYYVSAVNSLGCEGERKEVLAKVIVYDNAQITRAATGDSLQSNFANGNQWYFNHLPIPQATKQTLLADQSGTYSITVSIGDCSTSADYDFVKTPEVVVATPGVVTPTPGIIVNPETVVTAIEPAISDILFFPNPVSTEINVSVPKSLTTIKKIRLMDSVGRVIGFIELQNGSEMNTGHFDMTNYPDGLYILQVMGTQEIIEAKIIKQ